MKWVLTYAVKDEYIDLAFPGHEVIPMCTGVGKVNAAYHLAEAIHLYRPDRMLNIGTVGSVNHSVGDIFVCRKFVDRDMLPLSAFGLISEISFPAKADEPWYGEREGVCNTGDSFLTELTNVIGDVVDMEAFAQAIVCQNKQIPFVAVKFVTDIIGQNSVQIWQDKLAAAREGLCRFFQKYIIDGDIADIKKSQD